MSEGKKTVFFGPFVGEFGWELLFWHGWVKRLCRTRYKNYHKIACSFPGRYPFYPKVDKFLSLPADLLKIQFSSRGYITDCWINGLPKPSVNAKLVDMWPLVKKVIEDFKKKLPEDTEFIHPWQYRYDQEDKRYYGVKIKDNPKSEKDLITYNIPYSKQTLEPLKPTPQGIEGLVKLLGAEEEIIAIFPRKRIFRRPDKNWPKENYELLIELLQNTMPKYKIAIFGEPGGVFFTDGVPKGCIDLININSNYRMDIQLTALKRAKVAIGSQSGGIAFASASGCKAVTWGLPRGERSFRKENYMQSPFIFLTSLNPPLNLIIEYVKWQVGLSHMPLDNIKRILIIAFYRIFTRNNLSFLRKRVF